MTHFEEELRAALQPLAGDPHEVAERVMRELPRRPGRRWQRSAVLVGAAAAGVAAGMLLDAWVGPAAVAPDQPRPPAQSTPVAHARNAVLRTVIGRVTASRTGMEARPLTALAELEAGERLETHADSYAEVLFDDGTTVRMNAASTLALTDDLDVCLESGQIWVRFSPERQRVQHAQGHVQVDGEATLDLIGNPDELVVVALEGTAMLVSSDERRRRVKTMYRCSLRNGILRDRELVYWPFEVTSWQIALLCGEAYAEENKAMAKYLIGTLEHPDFFAMGEDGLRRMGPCAMDPLLAFLADTDPRRDRLVRRRAARVLADTAVYRGLEGLFGFLGDLDPEVRVAMYRGIRRITAVDRANERFWSSAPDHVRGEEARTWMVDLQERK